MMKSKFWSALIMGSAFAFMILSFQNCSPGFELLNPLNQSLSEWDGVIQDDIPADPNAVLSVYVRNIESSQGSDIPFSCDNSSRKFIDDCANSDACVFA